MTFPIAKKNNRLIAKFDTQKEVEIKKGKEYTAFQFFQKRLIDFIVGGSLLLVAMPVVLYTILRIKKESPGSIFFKQSRIGVNGKPFMCYKFRSMHVNSKFNPYTQENDARIFPFGNTMRKMRIDELPQLFNIMKGEMHLIGPRAEWDILVKDYEKIIPNYHERHSVAPGITGLAQVCYPYGRNVDDAKKKLEYDIEYITNWSFKKELMVIFKTIKVVLGKEGM
jgi:lipopolysaccharide/colanic/teichoic acid biosynthesis glycosyltransferase